MVSAGTRRHWVHGHAGRPGYFALEALWVEARGAVSLRGFAGGNSQVADSIRCGQWLETGGEAFEHSGLAANIRRGTTQYHQRDPDGIARPGTLVLRPFQAVE